MTNTEIRGVAPIAQYTNNRADGLVVGYLAVKNQQKDSKSPFSPTVLAGAIEVSEMMLTILGQAHIIKDGDSTDIRPIREITQDDIQILAERFVFYKDLFDRLNLRDKPVKSMVPVEERLRTCVRLLGIHLIDLGQKHLVKVEDLHLETRTQS